MHAAVQPNRNTDRRDDRNEKPDAPFSEQAQQAAAHECSDLEHAIVPSSDQTKPTEVQINAALVNALKSPEFSSAPQLRAFLEFVVRAALENKLEKIKGYTIAVEALGRPEDFNPVTDPIVRVEAARLRRRLTKYYAGSGAADPIRITVPKGSYAPAFELRNPAGHSVRAREPRHAFEGEGPNDDTSHSFEDLLTPVSEDIPSAHCKTDQHKPVSAADEPPLLLGAHDEVAVQPDRPVQPLFEMRVSILFATALAAGCFLAGFLAGSL